MLRLKNFAGSIVILALVALPSTTSGQNQDPPAESSTPKTTRPAEPQDPVTPSKFHRTKKPIPNRYIVILEDDVVSDNLPVEVRRERIAEIADSQVKPYDGKVDYIYETALKGYAVELPNEAAAIAISKLPRVKWVEEDAYGELGAASPSQKSAVATLAKPR
jgi:hypothetical protein